MKRTDHSLQSLQDLLKINADRVERHKKAGYQTSNPELKSFFYAVADESRKNISEINRLMAELYVLPESGKTIRPGKVYRSWIGMRSKFSGNNLLNACEFGELAALAAYGLAKDVLTDPSILELIERHQESLKTSLGAVKSYRQAYDKPDRTLVR
jgi:uncharacterized protein (TIGR02284 family)